MIAFLLTKSLSRVHPHQLFISASPAPTWHWQRELPIPPCCSPALESGFPAGYPHLRQRNFGIKARFGSVSIAPQSPARCDYCWVIRRCRTRRSIMSLPADVSPLQGKKGVPGRKPMLRLLPAQLYPWLAPGEDDAAWGSGKWVWPGAAH